MATPENTPISSAQQFKQAREAREAGDILTLASGLSVRVKRPEVTKMIAKGVIPSNMVQRFMALQGNTNKAVSAEDLESILGFQRIVAIHSLIEPKVVDENPNYEENEISVDDLDEADLDEIWQYANGGLKAVEMFRKERDAGLLPRSDSDKVSEPTTE